MFVIILPPRPKSVNTDPYPYDLTIAKGVKWSPDTSNFIVPRSINSPG